MKLRYLSPLLLAACASDDPAADPKDDPPAGTAIGADGGEVSSADGLVAVTFPPGALSESTTITVEPSATSSPGALGPTYELGPSGLSFPEPVEVVFSFDTADLGDVDLADLRVATLGPDGWEPLLDNLVSREGRVSGLTTHFSTFGLIPAADEPCECDVGCAESCCTGSFSGTPASCTCSSFDRYADFTTCYAECAGSLRVDNFCSGDLGACCEEAGGSSGTGDACVCLADTHAQIQQVRQCAAGYFSETDTEPTVCVGGGGSDGASAGSYNIVDAFGFCLTSVRGSGYGDAELTVPCGYSGGGYPLRQDWELSEVAGGFHIVDGFGWCLTSVTESGGSYGDAEYTIPCGSSYYDGGGYRQGQVWTVEAHGDGYRIIDEFGFCLTSVRGDGYGDAEFTTSCDGSYGNSIDEPIGQEWELIEL